jgi:CDP-paratose 2-epimerase
MIIREYFDMFHLRGLINRCGVLSGPWQMGKIDQGFVVFWVARHIYNKELSYIGYGDSGKQVRDVLHVDDIYRLIDIQLKHLDRLSGEVFNVGGGRQMSISLKELTALVQEITNNRIEIKRVNKERPDDIKVYISNNSKVTRMTGWSPSIGIKDMLMEINNWIHSNIELLKPIFT